jgi:DNA (cytosine-5)-methyltransferase 1
MIKTGTDRFEFAPGSEEKGLVRRLTVREAAEVQTFPSDFIFEYTNIVNGYKMVGNAVPVRLAEHLAGAIFSYLKPCSLEELVAPDTIQPGARLVKY